MPLFSTVESEVHENSKRKTVAVIVQTSNGTDRRLSSRAEKKPEEHDKNAAAKQK